VKTSDTLISIHPEYVRQILGGTKTVELRRTNLHLAAGQVLWIYATAPSSHVVARARVGFVDRTTPAAVWRKYRALTGLDRRTFTEYAGDCEQLTAISIAKVHPLKTPVSLSELRGASKRFHPPQLAMWMAETDAVLRLLRSRCPAKWLD
jgi:predicted transcriptional regulator